MNRGLSCLLLAALISGGALALQSASAQEGTPTPGQPTQGRVWIENRGTREAVPVSVQAVDPAAAPLRVQVTGTPTFAVSPNSIVGARTSRQRWEYQSVRIPADGNATATLNAAGAEGWETTGLVIPTPEGGVIVMKRPS